MYNGIGLQTPRGSGTNGYIQTNKFFVKPKTGKVAHTTKGFEADQGTGGITKKANKDILEHDRKRQIEVNLAELEDKLIEQGFNDAEIAKKLKEERLNLEAAAASEGSDGPSAVLVTEMKVSDTQSHQIAARKEKQMEKMRAALGLPTSEPHEQNEEASEDLPRGSRKNDNDRNKWSEKREHAFLDRDFSWKKQAQNEEKDDEKKAVRHKLSEERDEVHEPKSRKHRGSKHHDDSSDTDSGGKPVKGARRKHHKAKKSDYESDTDSGDSEGHRKTKEKPRRSRKHYSDGSSSDDGSDSYDDRKNRNSEKYKKSRRHDSESDSDVSSTDDDNDSLNDKKKNRDSEKYKKSRRRDSESESESDYSSADYDDDSRKQSHRKEVEKFNRSFKRHYSDDTDSGSDDKGRRSTRKQDNIRRYDNDNDDSTRQMRYVGKGYSKQEARESDMHLRRQDSDDDSDISLPKQGNAKKSKRHDSEDEFESDSEVKRRGTSARREISRQGGSRRLAVDDYDVADKRKKDESYRKSHKSFDRDSDTDSDQVRKHKKDRSSRRIDNDSGDDYDGKVDKGRSKRDDRNKEPSDYGNKRKADDLNREDQQYKKSRNQDVCKEREDDKFCQPGNKYGSKSGRAYEEKNDQRRDDSSRYVKSRGRGDADVESEGKSRRDDYEKRNDRSDRKHEERGEAKSLVRDEDLRKERKDKQVVSEKDKYHSRAKEDKYSEGARGSRGRTEEEGQGDEGQARKERRDYKRARYDKCDDHHSSERMRYRE